MFFKSTQTCHLVSTKHTNMHVLLKIIHFDKQIQFMQIKKFRY